ncbi:MAG: PHP domain-containing protein, partial [Burkholderiaceae bacterium]
MSREPPARADADGPPRGLPGRSWERPGERPATAGPPAYAELHCLSSFSFLRGASNPDELVTRAFELGYQAIALTDECSLAGVVRAHVQLRRLADNGAGTDERPLPKLLIGSEFLVRDEAGRPLFRLVLLACHMHGYGNLSQFITDLRRASPTKGEYRLAWSQIPARALDDCVALLLPLREAQGEREGEDEGEGEALLAPARWLLRHFSGRSWIGVELLRESGDARWLQRLQQLSEDTALPLVACGDVHMHRRSRKALQDVMSATRLGRTIADCGFDLQPNAERHLRSRLRLAQLYPAELMAQTLEVARRCAFSLDELRYQYPSEVVPAGRTPIQHLRQLTYEGMAKRWPQGGSKIMKPEWRQQIEHELRLIEELKYEHYFLTVADIVRFARSINILCQGRGSAANSLVCYCLHITSVDPARSTLLFERFISRERNEPPDIDVDFEHERREEVIQYLYGKYGRARAALTAVVISYRPRSAIRDVGKALGLDEDVLEALARDHHGWSSEALPEHRLRALQAELGLDPEDMRLRQLVVLSQQLMGMPRHLSQHVGGFVLTEGPLSRLVP